MGAADSQRSGNRLAGEQSPYLLQHAHNPVDWYPWGDEAFERARAEDKPIFLSVGYSTCHWCHVMERESFENDAIAALLNRHFVNIKVDREERPDVDRIYMTFVQATAGQGGWPMSVWLTPELKPFFGGTYFPPSPRHKHPGFGQLIEGIAAAWRERRGDIRASSEQIVEQLQRLKATAKASELDTELFYRAFKSFQAGYDGQHGGFGGAPKFPRPVTLNLLFRYFARTGDAEAARMCLHTLRQMAGGGMYDQLGGGFHRYSVDAVWHVPHFEKMLYDQAQLAKSYLDGYQVSGDAALAQQARGVFDYVLRDLTDAETGAFYSAEDADSVDEADGIAREGAFYVWAHDELEQQLGPALPLFARLYGVEVEGNAQDPHGELSGKNVLRRVRSLEQVADELELPHAAARQQLDEAQRKLLERRTQRPRPHLDDKVLCAWNGMMISALARGYSVLGERAYLEAAERAATFVEAELYDADGALLYRRYRGGERAIEAYLEDYAALVEGLIDLYEASLDLRWLCWAEVLTERQIELFADGEAGGFFASSGADASLILRLKDDYDGAEPSGNSQTACNLLRLAALLDRPEWEQLAAGTVRLFAPGLRQAPQIMPQLLVAMDALQNAPSQVVIVGERADPGVERLWRAAHDGYAPNKVIVLADAAFKARYGARLAHIAAMTPIEDKAAAYVCRNRSCDSPTIDPEQLTRQLGAIQLTGPQV